MTWTPRRLAEWAVLMATIVAVLLLAERHLISTRAVAGPSMEPTLKAGDRLLIDRWTLRQRLPRAGEIVVVTDAVGTPLVKRVARPPGGTISRETGVWLLGDNPRSSADSRQTGAVPVERLTGRVIWRYWPLSRAGPLADALPAR